MAESKDDDVASSEAVFLPGADSDSQYAIVPKRDGEAQSFGKVVSSSSKIEHYVASEESTDEYAKVAKEAPATPTDTQPPASPPHYQNIPPSATTQPDVLPTKATPTSGESGLRKDTFEYESLVFISDVLKQQPTPPSQQSSIHYETVVASPSPPADSIEQIQIVDNHFAATSSPIPGHPALKPRSNPFISPVPSFTALIGSPSTDNDNYMGLDKSKMEPLPEEHYEDVQPRFTDLYEPVEMRPVRDVPAEGIYEPVQVRQAQVLPPPLPPADSGSESDSFGSDEMIEDMPSEDDHSALCLTESQKRDHLLLPRFSVASAEEAYRRMSNLPENPYLSQAQMERVTMSIRGKRCAILPPMPTGLNRDETKRYLILDTIMSTERSYVDSLRRLIDVYATPLASQDGRHGGVTLKTDKLEKIFHKVQEIWMHHNMFLIALSSRASQWHSMVKIGDIFEGSFNKRMVIDDYTEYVNHFETALDTLNAEMAYSPFRKFLTECQSMSPDKLDIKSLLLKPIQRFPQFILCLQDMLRYTCVGHPDRVPLQLALTRLEFLAATLNNRKRAIESKSYIHELDKRMTNLEVPLQEKERRFIRLDFVEQQMRKKGKMASRRCCLFMLTDALICATLLKPKERGAAYRGKYKFKWMVPLSDVRLVDVDFALQRKEIERQNQAPKARRRRSPSAGSSDEGLDARSASLRGRRDAYLSDFAIVSQISGLVALLKNSYKVIDLDKTRKWCQRLQQRIVYIEEKIYEQESSRLDMLLPSPRDPSKEAIFTFIMESKKNKEAWLVALQMSLLKQRKQNNPGWLNPDDDELDSAADVPSITMPLFQNRLQICPIHQDASVVCGVLCDAGQGISGQVVWVCSEKGDEGLVSILSEEKLQVRVVETFTATSSAPLCCSFVLLKRRFGEERQTVWIGTRTGIISIFAADATRPLIERKPLLNFSCEASVRDIVSCCDHVFVALGNGRVLAYEIDAVSKKVGDFRGSTIPNSLWNPDTLISFEIGTGKKSVNSLSRVKDKVWCASGCTVSTIDAANLQIESSFDIEADEFDVISQIVCLGVGLWFRLQGSSTLQLYHVETRELLQSVSVANLIKRLPEEHSATSVSKSGTSQFFTTRPLSPSLTCLLAAHGRLWIGLSDGHVVALPVACLGGVPLTTGIGSVSVHRFRGGAVRFLLCSMPPRSADKTQKKSFVKQKEEDDSDASVDPSYISVHSLERRKKSIQKTIPEENEDSDLSLPSPPKPLDRNLNVTSSSLPPPPTPLLDEGRDVSVRSGSMSSSPPAVAGGESESKPAVSVDQSRNEYEIPWDLVKKMPAGENKREEGFVVKNEAISEIEGDQTNSILYQDDHLEADGAEVEKTLVQVRGEKFANKMVMAGGEGYIGTGGVDMDDAGVIVWRIDN